MRLWYKCFPVNFVKFSKTPLLQDTPRRLLLNFPKTSIPAKHFLFGRTSTSFRFPTKIKPLKCLKFMKTYNRFLKFRALKYKQSKQKDFVNKNRD